MKDLILGTFEALKLVGVSIAFYLISCIVNFGLSISAVVQLVQKDYTMFWTLIGVVTLIGMSVTAYIFIRVCKYFKKIIKVQ